MMWLSDLVKAAAVFEPLLGWDHRAGSSGDPRIRALRLDSRHVEPGDLFICVPGQLADGHDFVADAADRGASALLVERWITDHNELDQIKVSNVRRAMAWMSAAFNHHPSQDLKVVGVTGTNGKTTTAHLVKAILDHAGVPCGLIGTLTGTRTTPASPHLQASLRGMVDDGLGAVAIEVSSHALTQHRPLGTEFDVGVFTNLSADHLDYHGSMDEYFDAKALLFRTGMVSAAVVNDSDAYGRRLLAELDVPTTPYSSDQASGIELGLAGSTFTWREQGVSLALPGLFNLENAIAAAEATRFLGLDDGAIAAGLSAAGQVAGRFEVVEGPPGATVIVDYAHSPAGLERLLESVRAIDPTATVCVVFGAGGDRDREKRPLMGAAAAANADHIILTSDNPRSEDPGNIIEEIRRGIDDQSKVEVEPDRRRAIASALAQYGAGDVIVVAGKGHETTQTIADTVLEFDDRNVVRELISAQGRA